MNAELVLLIAEGVRLHDERYGVAVGERRTDVEVITVIGLDFVQGHHRSAIQTVGQRLSEGLCRVLAGEHDRRKPRSARVLVGDRDRIRHVLDALISERADIVEREDERHPGAVPFLGPRDGFTEDGSCDGLRVPNERVVPLLVGAVPVDEP